MAGSAYAATTVRRSDVRQGRSLIPSAAISGCVSAAIVPGATTGATSDGMVRPYGTPSATPISGPSTQNCVGAAILRTMTRPPQPLKIDAVERGAPRGSARPNQAGGPMRAAQVLARMVCGRWTKWVVLAVWMVILVIAGPLAG